MRRLIALAVAATALIAGCSSGGSSTTAASGTATAAPMGVLTIGNEGGETWPCQFNPFNPSVYWQSFGIMYESLDYVNPLRNGEVRPMLATSYAWSPDKRKLSFDIRSGVTWSDGKPFTAADVLYTFNLIHKNPGLDLYSLFSGHIISGVSATGSTFTVTFYKAAAPYFFYIADQIPIVPEHIWSTVGNPVAYPDRAAIGTGPFTMHVCTPANVEYTANLHYWMPGEPHVAKVEYPAYTTSGPCNLDLATGKAQWGGQFIPNIDQFYVARDPAHNHYWEPPVANLALFPNLTSGATSKLAVREAISYALNRTTISTVGEGTQEPPANQTGIVTPTFTSWINTAADQSFGYPSASRGPNLDKAKSLLASAGYSPSHPLALNVITVSGYTDWDASLNEMKQELAPIGINLTVLDQAQQTYNDNLFKGNFQLAYYADAPGPTPYYELRQVLDSTNSAPIGQDAATNFERYSNPAVDRLFDAYAVASPSQQVNIVKAIEVHMLADVPIIPIVEEVDWYQYSTKMFTGWPTPSDPYAQPQPSQTPDIGQVLLGLKAV
jgi:peptide/nickel transport system substrate-binding protein